MSAVFVSYSRKDAFFVRPLARLVRASGHEVFLDHDSQQYGESWRTQIDQAIARSKRMLVFWSKSASASQAVRDEYEAGLATPSCTVVPVLLDRTPLPPSLGALHGESELQVFVRQRRRERWLMRGSLAVLPVLVLGAAWVPFSLSSPAPPQQHCPHPGDCPIESVGTDPVAWMIPLLGLAVAVVAGSWLWFRRRRKRAVRRFTARLDDD